MKNPLHLFLTLAIILIYSCVDLDTPPQPELNYCDNDHAEYYHNGTLFQTAYTPGGGEIMTPAGTNCGIGAVISHSDNNFILRVFGEERELNMHADISILNQEQEFSFLQYTDIDTFIFKENLISTNQNYLLINELDTIEKRVKGVFNFKIENITGDTITIEDGTFDASYHEF